MKELLLIQTELSTSWASWRAPWEGLSLLLILVHLCVSESWTAVRVRTWESLTPPHPLFWLGKPSLYSSCSLQGNRLSSFWEYWWLKYTFFILFNAEPRPWPESSFIRLLALSTLLVPTPALGKHMQVTQQVIRPGELLSSSICSAIRLLTNRTSVGVTTKEAAAGTGG